ncbi:hypothetical protein ZWY2020_028379, partial [Hordeum vulgare]
YRRELSDFLATLSGKFCVSETGLMVNPPELMAPYTSQPVAVPENCRAMFITFSKENALQREEIFQYFRQAKFVNDVADSNLRISDSDYDIHDGDDDVYEDNIDYDVDEEAEREVEDVEPEYLLEDEDLNLSIEQQEQLKHKFTSFNSKVDMKCPAFTFGYGILCG